MCTGTGFAFQRQNSDEVFFDTTKNYDSKSKFSCYLLNKQIPINIPLYTLLKQKKVYTYKVLFKVIWELIQIYWQLTIACRR